MKPTILAVAIATAASATAQANNPNLEEVTIIGSREAAQTLPGSGSVVDSSRSRSNPPLTSTSC